MYTKTLWATSRKEDMAWYSRRTMPPSKWKWRVANCAPSIGAKGHIPNRHRRSRSCEETKIGVLFLYVPNFFLHGKRLYLSCFFCYYMLRIFVLFLQKKTSRNCKNSKNRQLFKSRRVRKYDCTKIYLFLNSSVRNCRKIPINRKKNACWCTMYVLLNTTK
jgi:hypothetical protein